MEGEVRKRWTGFIVFVILASFGGVIGNRSDAAFVENGRSFARFFASAQESGLWRVLFLSFMLLLVQIIAFLLIAKAVRKSLRREIALLRNAQDQLSALKDAIAVVELDDTLFRLLPRLATALNVEEAMTNLVVEFFRDATSIFGDDVSRGMLLKVEGDYLVAWIGYQMPEETLKRTRFSLSSPNTTGQGVALRTFRDGRLRVVHLTREAKGHRSKWKPDSRHYKAFADERPHPPYRSFATVAVGDGLSQRVGVLCFDSMNSDAFDPDEVQRFLTALGRRLGAAMQIYEQWKQFRHNGP
jgi:hypothetical protein